MYVQVFNDGVNVHMRCYRFSNLFLSEIFYLSPLPNFSLLVISLPVRYWRHLAMLRPSTTTTPVDSANSFVSTSLKWETSLEGKSSTVSYVIYTMYIVC